MSIEKKVESFYRNLDTKNYNLFEELENYAERMRKGAQSLENQEARNNIYGIIAEETAFFLLRMYKDAGFPIEILDSLVIEYEPGETTEIDLVAITPNTVYIIECKHRSRDIRIERDGSFSSEHGNESPVKQNMGHILKIFNKTGYGAAVPKDRILNMVFLKLNGCKVTNPITEFKKTGVNGVFAGTHNLLPYIHKTETEGVGGRIPYIKLADKLRKMDLGEKGKAEHVARMKKRFGNN